MPSGYTHEIYEGKEVSAKEFILKCARAFGATVTMRDEPLDKEIPEFEPSDYHLRAIEKAKQQLDTYKNMTIDEAEKELDESYAADVKRYYERIKEKTELQERYTKVLSEVGKWIPPTEDHQALKEYAIDQLQQSIDFDCKTTYINFPKKQSASEWLEEASERCENDIRYHEKEWKEELKRTKERNLWVKQLKESL